MMPYTTGQITTSGQTESPSSGYITGYSSSSNSGRIYMYGSGASGGCGGACIIGEYSSVRPQAPKPLVEPGKVPLPCHRKLDFTLE